MKANRVKLITTLWSVILITGCASVINGGQDKVNVFSVPDKVEFTVKNEDNEVVARGVTPLTLTLDRANGYFDGEKYQVEFEKQDYWPQTAVIDSDLSGVYLGNFILGGLIGLLIVDPATGGMWDLDDQISVKMSKKSQLSLAK